jgi:hypothetical protein
MYRVYYILRHLITRGFCLSSAHILIHEFCDNFASASLLGHSFCSIYLSESPLDEALYHTLVREGILLQLNLAVYHKRVGLHEYFPGLLLRQHDIPVMAGESRPKVHFIFKAGARRQRTEFPQPSQAWAWSASRKIHVHLLHQPHSCGPGDQLEDDQWQRARPLKLCPD